MKKYKRERQYYLFLLFGLIFFLVCIFSIKHILNVKNTKHEINNVVPTISPSNEEGWEIFIYPDDKKGFSFEFPSTWDVKMEEISNDLPTIIFTYKENSENYTFSINGNNIGEYYGNTITSLDETKVYAGRKTNLKTLYKKGIPFAVVVYFDNFDSKKDGVMIINMELPSTNHEKYQMILERILSSFKFHY